MKELTIRRVRMRVVLGTIVLGAAGVLHAQDGAAIRQPPASSAWEQSLAREAQGDLNGARKIMLDAFGARPTTYDPCVRLAWLNFQMKNGAEAVLLYRRARELPGSLPEATTGLGLALTMRGYAELARGALGQARASWSEALGIDASNADALHGNDLIGGASGIAPEFWAASISATKGSSTAQVYYAGLATRLDTDLGVRMAFRQVASPSPVDTSGAFATQSEFFGGITRDFGPASIEVLAFSLSGVRRSQGGAAVNLRVGGSYGLTTVASIISRPGGTNVQVMPMAFVYLSPSIAISGGARFTSDSAFSGVSPMAAIGMRHGALQFDVAAHAGKEQWAFSAAGPTILSFLDETTGGFTATAGWQPVHAFAFFAQLQSEQTKSSGTFRSIGAGVRLNP